MLMVIFARALSTRVAVQGIVLSAAVSFVASLLSSVLVIIVRAQRRTRGRLRRIARTPRWRRC